MSGLIYVHTFIAIFISAISASMASSLAVDASAWHEEQQELDFGFVGAGPASISSLSEETFGDRFENDRVLEVDCLLKVQIIFPRM